MIIIYRILFPILGILFSPYFLRRMIRRGGYGNKIGYRLGGWPKLPKKKKEKKRIWLQAVSVGEISSVTRLVNDLLAEENFEVVLSGTTSTGLKVANDKFGGKVLAHGPFPLDWLPFSQRAWRRIDPDMIIMVDSELWPEHFQQARLRGTPTLIINARLSDRSFSRLKKISWIRPLVLPENMKVLTASERQTARWQELGLKPTNISTAGNLKIDAVKTLNLNKTNRSSLLHEFGFEKGSTIVAGISTWPREEKLLLEIIQSLRLENLDVRLLLIPRHAERSRDLVKVIKNCSLPFQVRTQRKIAAPGNIVYLADTTGELSNLIRIADVGFMGKTLPPNRGGQNPIEPIALGIPLVVGPNYQNFHETCTDMFLGGAAISCKNSSSVIHELSTLIKDPQKRSSLQKSCEDWMLKQGSPSEFTLGKIKEILTKPR